MIEQRPYIGPDRRQTDRRSDDVAEHIKLFVAQEFKAHEEREKANVNALIDSLKAEAFPDTPAQHKAAHQAMIDASKAEEAFWKDLKGDIAKKSILGIAQILFILVAAGLTAKFGLTALGGMK